MREVERQTGIGAPAASVTTGGWVHHALVVATVEAVVVGEVAVGSISDGSTACVTGTSWYSSIGNDYQHYVESKQLELAGRRL